MTIPGPRGSSRRGARTSAFVIQPRAGVLPLHHRASSSQDLARLRVSPTEQGVALWSLGPGHPDKLDSDSAVGGTRARSRHSGELGVQDS